MVRVADKVCAELVVSWNILQTLEEAAVREVRSHLVGRKIRLRGTDVHAWSGR